MRVGQMGWAAVLVMLGAQGCLLAEASSSKKFSDTVEQLNKATRWGQIGQATNMIDPSYRAKFTDSHAGWGESIQVADTEVMQLELTPNQASATAVISYEWYLMSAMTLHQSVVRQRWSSAHGGFGLISEVVVKGDPRLLAPSTITPSSPSVPSGG